MVSIPLLPAIVHRRFKTAQETGDIQFYETQVSLIQCHGQPFQIRYSPALANKPKATKPKDTGKPFDPFENPPKALFIADLPGYNLVLNKFPVIPDHFILATKDFKEQTYMLEEEDLGAAYACIRSYRMYGEHLFGFFNSGEHSGASQRRRHIQFLPIDSMKSGMVDSDSYTWDVLANKLLSNPSMPFTYFAAPLPENPTPKQLHNIYIELHGKACGVSGISYGYQNPESPISYNLGMTGLALILCPRTAEGTQIQSDSGDVLGSVSLNGTVLGGTLLVKSKAEWDALNGDEIKLNHILGAIGITPSNGEEKL